MSIDWFLEQVKSRFDSETARSIISAFRQEPLIWKSLENETFQANWLDFADKSLERWNPGILAEFAVSPELATFDLKDLNIEIPDTILIKAGKTLETIQLTGLAPGSLTDAFFMAGNLRQYRISERSWKGLSVFLSSPKNNFRVWRSAFACLPSIIPDFKLLVEELSRTAPKSAIPSITDLIIHAVECIPSNENQRYQTLTDLLDKAGLDFQIESLKHLGQGQDVLLVKLLAINFLAQNPVNLNNSEILLKGLDGTPSLSQVKDYQRIAELSKMAGQPVQAAKAIDQAFSSLNYAQAAILHDLAIELESGDTEEARKTWEEVLRLSPENKTYRQEYAEFLLAHDDKEHGLELLSTTQDKGTSALFALRYPDLMEADTINSDVLKKAVNRAENSRFTKESDNFIAARYALEHKNYHLAEDFIEKALQSNPNDIEAIKLSGTIHQHLADVDKAIESTSLLAMFEPDNINYKRKLASLFLQTQQPQKAFEIYREIISANKENSRDDLLTYSEIAIKAGNPEVAIPISENFLSGDNLDGEALVNLCNAYISKGDEESAVRMLESTSAVAPEKPSSWLSLAKIWTNLGNTEKAMDSLRKAKAALPDDPTILAALGMLYLDNDKPTEAISALKQAYELDPSSTEIRKSLAKAYLHHGYVDEAWSVIRPLESEYTTDPDLSLTLGKILLSIGDRTESKPILRFAWQSSRSDEALKTYTSLILEQKKIDGGFAPVDQMELNDLLSALSEKINADPGKFDLRILAADVQSALGKYGEAYQEYLILLDMPEAKSRRPYHHLQLQIGRTALKMGMNDISLASLQEAVLVDPDDLDSRHELAEAYLQADLQEEGTNAARASLQLAPTNLENVLWYSDFADRNQNQREAIQVLKDTLHLLPHERALYLTLARTYQKQGNVRETKEILNQMLESEDISTEEFVNVANIYLHMNETEEASNILKKAISNNPEPNFEETRDLAYSILQLGDAAAALQLLEEIRESLGENPCFPILKSDILAANKQFIPAIQTLDPLLRQLEFSNDLHCFETKSFPENHEIPSYSKSGVFYRAAQLERMIGDLTAAQKYAELANTTEPKVDSTKLLLAELAFSVRNTSKLEDLLDSLNTSDSKNQEIAQLLALNGLINGNVNEAGLVIEHFLSKQPPSVLTYAINAISSHSIGNRAEAENSLASAQKLLAALAAQDQRGSFSISRHFNLIWASLSVSIAAWTLGRWNEANQCLQDSLKEVKVNPVVNQLVAEYLVDKARETNNAHLLHVVEHAPQPFNSQTNDDILHEEQISVAGRYIAASAMIPTLKIGQAIFSGHWSDSDEISQIVKTGKQAAQVLSVQVNPESIKEIVSGFKDNFDVNLQYAVMMLHEQPDLSKELANKLVAEDPENPLIHTILALAAQNPTEAAEMMEKALSIWSNEPDWHALAADFYEKAGEYSKAAHHMEEAIQILPKDAQYWQMLGDIKLLEKDYHAAKDYFGKAIDLFPNNPEALESLATINQQLGEYQVAIQCLQRAAQLDPANPAYVEQIAQSLLARKEYSQAFEQANKVLQTHPTSGIALQVKVKSLMGKHQYEEARRIAQAAREIVKDPIPFSLLAIEIDAKLTKRGGLGLAMKLAEENPDNVEVLNTLANYQIEAGQVKEAELTLQKSLALDTENPKTLLALGRIDRSRGNLDQALAHLSRALKINPSLTEIYLEIGQTYQDRREVNKAIEVYHKAIEMIGNDPRAYIQAAAAYKDSKDYRNAEFMLRQAAQISPTDPSIRRQLAGIVALNLVNNLQEAPKRK